MPDIVNIGLSGLRAHQSALSVTGNNVANANTEGYSRQEAIFEASPSTFSGGNYFGEGVGIETINRIAEDFAVNQLRSDTTLYSQREAILDQSSALDNLLASPSTGLTPALSNFFEAVQGAADDPTSIPQRQLLLTEAESLVSRFRSLDQALTSQQNLIDQELEAAVSTVNSLAQGLVETNIAISEASVSSTDNANELLDARDQILLELAEYVDVTSVQRDGSGQVNVFIGNGQPLVVGTTFTPLQTSTSPADSTVVDITMLVNGQPQIVTDRLTSGRMGALLSYRDTELLEAQNGLGRIALIVNDTVNEQHGLGMDLENNLGGLFFDDINEDQLTRSRVIPNANNPNIASQTVRLEIVDSSVLTADDYTLRFSGPSDQDIEIVRNSTGEVALATTLPGTLPARVEVDGFDVIFDEGTFQAGESFKLQPTHQGAQRIERVIDRVEEIALAAPIRASANIGNVGTANISAGEMFDIDNPITNQRLDIFSGDQSLEPPLLIEFIRDNYYNVLDNSNPAAPVPLQPPMNNIRFDQGINNALFTTDPGETIVSATGSDSDTTPSPTANTGPFANGFGAQNVTLVTRDNETGSNTTQSYSISANESAASIAAGLTQLTGVEATAYTTIRVENIFDNGGAIGREWELNGQRIVMAADENFDAEYLADVINNGRPDTDPDPLINNSVDFSDTGIYATLEGDAVLIHSETGEDISIGIFGFGESFDVSKVDPYTAGNPSFGPTTRIFAGQAMTVGGSIDVRMATGITMTSDADTVFQIAPPALASYKGFNFDIQGQAVQGDAFEIEYNTDGISDNRNALALSRLEANNTVSNNSTSYGEAYAQIVEEVGTFTARARLDEEAADSLLEQSKLARDSVSGVNLDEEAGRLIQYQAAYNASAQVVSIARDLFDTLINTFR